MYLPHLSRRRETPRAWIGWRPAILGGWNGILSLLQTRLQGCNYGGCQDALFNSASTSARVGMDGAVPCLVTEMPATAHPNCVAARMSRPSERAMAKPPLNASPAPVVSTTGPASIAGTAFRKGRILHQGALSAERHDHIARAACQ